MRASSLSSKEVIDLLTRYFIPVEVSSRAVRERGGAEQKEHERIQRSALQGGFNNWSVGAYVVDPDGTTLGALQVQLAAKPSQLLPWLKRFVEQKHLRPRDSHVVRSASASAPQAPKPKLKNGLLLHVVTGYEEGHKHLGLTHDWVELTPSEWAAFIPPADARVGTSWDVPQKVANRVHVYFFPALSDHSAKTSVVEKASLKATISALSTEEAEIALSGSLEMVHREPRDQLPPAGIRARLIGVAKYDRKQRSIRSFQMISEDAVFTLRWYHRGETREQPEKFVIAVERQP